MYKDTSFLNNKMASWTYYPFPVGLQPGSKGVNIYLLPLTYYHTDMLIEFCFNYLILSKWKKKHFLIFTHWSPVCAITLPLASWLYTKMLRPGAATRPAPLPVPACTAGNKCNHAELTIYNNTRQILNDS